MKYQGYIFQNGRIAWVSEKDFGDAIELGKEILISCGGWSGGYTMAIGANKTTYYGEPCWECYGYDIKDQSFTSEEMKKFHKIIFTDGIRVYMKTGEPPLNILEVGLLTMTLHTRTSVINGILRDRLRKNLKIFGLKLMLN